MLGNADAGISVKGSNMSHRRALVLAVAALAASASAASTRGPTERLSSPAQKARIDAIAADVVAVIPGEAAPVRATLERWMQLFAR